jgi:hypothetical protein
MATAGDAGFLHPLSPAGSGDEYLPGHLYARANWRALSFPPVRLGLAELASGK